MSLSVIEDDRMPGLAGTRHEGSRREEPAGFGLKDLQSIFRRRLVLIVLVTLLGTLASVVLSIELPKVYTAKSMILLKPDDPNLLDGGAQSASTQPNASRLDTETDLMTSRVFAGRVVDELNLIADPSFNTFLPESSTDAANDGSQASVGPLSWLVGRIKALLPFGADDDDALPPSEIQRDRAVTVFLSKLAITRSGESNAMTVAVSDDDPTRSASLANGVTSLYTEWSRDLKQDSTREAVNFLRTQASELAVRVSGLEQEIADYSSRENVSSDPRDDLLRATMQQANEQLGTARGDLARAKSVLAQAQSDIAGGRQNPMLSSEFLTTLRGEEATAVRERAEIARNFGSSHPLIRDADAKIESVRSMISAELQRIVASSEGDVRVAEGRVTTIENELAASQQELRRRARAEIRFRELNRDLLTEQQLYDLVSARIGKLDPYSEVANPNARVISLAAIPTEPSFPKAHTLVAGGFVGSVILAFVAAIGLESLDTRVRSVKRLSQNLRTPVLALVPRLPRRGWKPSPGVLMEISEHPRSALAEIFRGVYGACKRARMGRQGQVVLVSSGLPLEGKTSTALGLAAAAASEGARTIIVDLDLRTSGLCRWMPGNTDARPLNEYLDGECGLRDVVDTVPDIPNLSLVRSSAVAGLMGQRPGMDDRLERLIETFRSEYDMVVLDTPPVLVVEDAAVIAPLADAVILVAGWGRTTEDALSEAAERLQHSAVPLIGIVLNLVDATTHRDGVFRGARVRRQQLGRYFTQVH